MRTPSHAYECCVFCDVKRDYDDDNEICKEVADANLQARIGVINGHRGKNTDISKGRPNINELEKIAVKN